MANRNLVSYRSGSLGALVPPLVVTFKSQAYGGVLEESVHFQFHIVIVTGPGLLLGTLGMAANYPLDITNSKCWPQNVPYASPKQYIISKLQDELADPDNLPVSDLDSMVVENIGALHV